MLNLFTSRFSSNGILKKKTVIEKIIHLHTPPYLLHYLLYFMCALSITADNVLWVYQKDYQSVCESTVGARKEICPSLFIVHLFIILLFYFFPFIEKEHRWSLQSQGWEKKRSKHFGQKQESKRVRGLASAILGKTSPRQTAFMGVYMIHGELMGGLNIWMYIWPTGGEKSSKISILA